MEKQNSTNQLSRLVAGVIALVFAIGLVITFWLVVIMAAWRLLFGN